MPDRHNPHNGLCLVKVVENSEAVHPQFPLGQSVWPQNFVVSCLTLRLVLQTRIDLVHDSLSVSLVMTAEVFDGLRRVPDLEHASQPFYQEEPTPLQANDSGVHRRAALWRVRCNASLN